MPIYEFLCRPCNRVFSFLAKTAAEANEPSCPKCGGRDMKKLLSTFSLLGGTRKSVGSTSGMSENGAEGEQDALDDPKVEREMMKLMHEAEGMDENDPRQLGRLMRKMSEITGEDAGPEMEEAMRRLEAGEDPDAIEDDLGDVLGDAPDAGMAGPGAPSRDNGLYQM